MPHWSHRSAPPPGQTGLTRISFSHPTLAGIALITTLIDVGEELVFLGDATPGLARLVPLFGGKAVFLPMQERPDAARLWGAVGPRTRGVVLAHPSEDELALLAETDVTVVLDQRGDPLPEGFSGLSISSNGGAVTLSVAHPEGAAYGLAIRLAYISGLLDPQSM